ncbi:protein FAM214A isoform A [Alligator mississippiensis]|uniref:Atos homolog protein A n=1 Tax=Alligator mississippiensis TaxID=8496 RepID=A0A151M9N0_ALLMI|nr:protein FAM214A isoform A [Alligator mississippiensis]
MKPERDALDEYFEYEAEEFLVSLALLITEGRTPEHSVKGRTEGFHCPPAQSSQPLTTKHECSDKLAQCRQAKRTRSEVMLLWKNNIPIMIEVMLLPDCCYSDEGPTSEGNDLNDPAIKQDALLLERWILEPVPRQSGDRFIEEKTLLLAVRSFVFFSQLSAWLSVSHGAVPRNILYRVSAADVDLQWTFSQTPTEHVFPVPNVSHNVALKERQEVIARIAQHLVHCDPTTPPKTGCPLSVHETNSATSKIFRSTYEDESLLRKSRETSSVSLSIPDITSSEDGSEGKMRGMPEIPLLDSHVPVNHSRHQPVGEMTNPLIGSLLQERQEVIARIAQHLIHCDPATSHIAGHPFSMHEASSVASKMFRNSCEDENSLKRSKETASVSLSKTDLAALEDLSKLKTKTLDTPISSCRPDGELKASPKPQARRKLLLAKPNEVIQNTFQQALNKTVNSLTSTHTTCIKENKSELPDKLEIVFSGYPHKDQETSKSIAKQCSNSIDDWICTNKLKEKTIISENSNIECASNPQIDRLKILGSMKKATLQTSDILHKNDFRCLDKDSKNPNIYEQNTQLVSIENYLNKDHDNFKCKNKQDKVKNEHDENEDPTDHELQSSSQKKPIEDCLSRCERLKKADVQRPPSFKHSNIWRKHNFRSLDGTSTKAFHPRTGLPLLSSPVPQRKMQSGCFDLDSSLLQLKCFSTRSQQQCINRETDPDVYGKSFLSSSAPPITSLSLLGNFEESVLNYRLDPLGIVDGFTAEVGASGVFCPTHMTLPVEVSFYSVSDDNAPSPYMGVITLESLGKRGYRVPPSGTIQVTLFNPNKTVVKMFVVIYDLREMPANHQTFLRQRTFSVPVRREVKRSVNKENIQQTEERLLRYLIHLRFQSSKSGKIYLHRDVRLLFSRKSMEVDSGAAYELKSYTESPTNPQFSPRC